jgi:hypothetical protein
MLNFLMLLLGSFLVVSNSYIKVLILNFFALIHENKSNVLCMSWAIVKMKSLLNLLSYKTKSKVLKLLVLITTFFLLKGAKVFYGIFPGKTFYSFYWNLEIILKNIPHLKVLWKQIDSYSITLINIIRAMKPRWPRCLSCCFFKPLCLIQEPKALIPNIESRASSRKGE